ncbi:MAG: hypothetical protein ACP5NC_01630 [Nitrososphaeria archaeon]
MAPCECPDDRIRKILDALRKMDSREFESLIRKSEVGGKSVDQLIEESLTRKQRKLKDEN